MKTADLIGGSGGVALGAYVLYEGSQMPPDLIMKIGPSFFPDMLAVGLIAFSLLLLVNALRGRTRGSAEPIRFDDPGIRRALVALVAVIVYAAALVPVGYPVVTPVLVAGLMILLGKRDPRQIALVSIATTVGVWFVFAKMLMLSMPMGLLEDLF